MSNFIDYFIPEFSGNCENCNVKFDSEFQAYIHMCDFCTHCDEYNCKSHYLNRKEPNCNLKRIVSGESYDWEMGYLYERWKNCSVCKGTGRIPVVNTLCDRCCDVTYDDGPDWSDDDGPDWFDDGPEPYCGDGCCYCRGIGDCEICGENRRDD